MNSSKKLKPKKLRISSNIYRKRLWVERERESKKYAQKKCFLFRIYCWLSLLLVAVVKRQWNLAHIDGFVRTPFFFVCRRRRRNEMAVL